MNPKWHFNQRRACDRMRDSANDAFFTAESLENLSEALVREGIQNSLDAAARQSQNIREVHVRISLVADAPTKARVLLKKMFGPAKEHFEKGLTGGSFDAIFSGGSSYLVFEDFGTRGLNGDTSEWQLEKAGNNAFFSFFRAEGRSAKSGDNLGRWGIGKQVFPTASRLHAMFGVTVRNDNPTEVLMGSAVVRTHMVDAVEYQPDGWFGDREDERHQVMPISSAEFLSEFKDAFDLRRSEKKGLSIVVPCVDERINADDLRRGIIRNFFWPILLGELVVDLDGPEGSWNLNAESIPGQLASLQASEAATVEFALWASIAKPSDIVKLDEVDEKRPDWRLAGPSLLCEPKLEKIRESLNAKGKVGVRIPVLVRPKQSEPARVMSFFTVYIAACRDNGHRPLFLRDGIVIKDVRAPQLRGTRSLVVVDDAPLAGLLGDSEGVNHTQWQRDSPKFHNRYVYGPDTIKFVTRSVYELMQALHSGETKGDPNLLLHLFFLPNEDGKPEVQPKPNRAPGPTTPPPPPDPPPPPSPRKFTINKADGGFRICPSSTALETLPLRIRIEAAYAVRKGNPMKRWASDDFVFCRLPLRYTEKVGVVVIREEKNVIELEIRKAEFEFGVCGFDKKRDLVVRATALKEDHEDNN